jgi:hypothetical protein
MWICIVQIALSVGMGTVPCGKLHRRVVQSRNYGVSRRAFVISTAAACGLIEARYEAVMPRMLKFGCE